MGGLSSQVQGTTRYSQLIVWYQSEKEGSIVDLTGASISGCLRDRRTGVIREITGNLVVTKPAEGQFRWDYSADDVSSAGTFIVQFTAVFPLEPNRARSKVVSWTVEPSLCSS